MAEYQSIKEDVIAKLEVCMPEIRERFCIEDLSLFGSLSRGEDTSESDIDILYTFLPGRQHSNTLKTFRHT
ncbi:MAG TPA: nucleotidyltransferase domain-containing protein [Methanocorpusculum sp.]|nr:nucleotidyltransferase domain-containing protein [Methanocorpusculum sp.]